MSVTTPRERVLRFRPLLPSAALPYLPTVALAIDVVAVLLASALGALARQRLPFFDAAGGPLAVEHDYLVMPAFIGVWVLALAFAGAYAKSGFDHRISEFRAVAMGTLAAAGILSGLCYLVAFPLSRGFFLASFLVGLPLLVAGRLVLDKLVRHAREVGSLQRNVLLVGTTRSVDEVARVLRREKQLGMHIAGALVSDTPDALETPQGTPILGHNADAIDVVRQLGAEVVFFADGGIDSTDHMRQVAWDLEHDNVQVVVAPSVSDVSGDRVRVRPLGGLPLIYIDRPRTTDASRWGKRVFDAVAAAGLLVAASPFLLFAALRIKLHDGGPILFSHTRIGRNGVPFKVLKFRTMVVDAESKQAALQAAMGHEGAMFKAENDPRITKPGRWLRRLSIDELPQLVNVIRGDMSLIGPRPQVAAEVAVYPEEAHRRLRVRPGLTGLWQVSGRSDLSFEEAIRLDLYYVDNWSIVQDLAILAKTANAVLRSRGAY